MLRGVGTRWGPDVTEVCWAPSTSSCSHECALSVLKLYLPCQLFVTLAELQDMCCLTCNNSQPSGHGGSGQPLTTVGVAGLPA